MDFNNQPQDINVNTNIVNFDLTNEILPQERKFFTKKKVIYAILLFIIIVITSDYLLGGLGNGGLIVFFLAPSVLVLYLVLIGLAYFFLHKLFSGVHLSWYAKIVLPLLAALLLGAIKYILFMLGILQFDLRAITSLPFSIISQYILYLWLYWIINGLFFAKPPSTIPSTGISRYIRLFFNGKIDRTLTSIIILLIIFCYSIVFVYGKYQSSKLESLTVSPGTFKNNDQISVTYQSLNLKLQTLGSVQNGEDIKRFIVSPDGKRYAYSQLNIYKNLYKLVVDGKEVENGSKVDSIIFSPDSQHFAYVLVNNSNSNKALVLNGVKQKEYLLITNIKFSPDSKHHLYSVNNGNHFIVRDGEEGPQFNGIENISYSMDGKHIAYRASQDDTSFIVLENIPQKKYKGGEGPVYKDPIFSSNNDLVYIVGNLNYTNLVKNGEVFRDHRFYKFPQFSKDGKYFVYLATDIGLTPKTFITINGKKGKDNIGWGEWLILSNDGKHFAYAITDHNNTTLIIDEAIINSYNYNNDIRNFVFSPDAKNFAYDVHDKKTDTSILVINNQQISVNYSIQKIIFSPDGNKVLVLGSDPLAYNDPDRITVVSLKQSNYIVYSTNEKFTIPSTQFVEYSNKYIPTSSFFSSDSNEITFINLNKEKNAVQKITITL